MKQYHKIQTVYKRNPDNMRELYVGQYTLPEFEYLKDNIWVFDEKVDGTNIRVMWNGESVVFGGKSDNAQMPTFLLYKLQELFEGTTKKEIFKTLFVNTEPDLKVCLYGEGYGAKIQSGGKYIPDGVDFVLFDVNINGFWMEREFVETVAKTFGIKITPIVGEGTLQDGIDMVKKGFNSKWGDFIAEGLILRPKVQILDRRGHRIITKIKNRDFATQ